MHCNSVLSLSPSFNTYSSGKFADIAVRVVEEFRAKPESQVDEAQENNKEEDDFEFTFVCREFDSSISADEIFYNGQIRPVFPIFNRDSLIGDVENENSGYSKPPAPSIRLPLRKFLIEERDSSSCSSSEADEREPGMYCVWTPKSAAVAEASPERWKTNSSTGALKRWKFRDLLRRSNSDGKDTFIFLTPSNASKKREERVEKATREASKAAGKVTAKRVAGGEGGPVAAAAAAHESHYAKKGAVKEGDRRQSFLPYRQDLVGLFANVNGLSRNLHPF